jgi:hypothetical protein
MQQRRQVHGGKSIVTGIKAAILGAAVLLAAGIDVAHAQTTYGPPTPQAFPITPFQASLILFAGNSSLITGPGKTGVLGITSISFANQSSAAVQINMFQVTTSGAKCTGSITEIRGGPDVFVMIPPLSTLQTTYPTPLVIGLPNQQSCIGFEGVNGLSNGYDVGILVNGYLN